MANGEGTERSQEREVGSSKHLEQEGIKFAIYIAKQGEGLVCNFC